MGSTCIGDYTGKIGYDWIVVGLTKIGAVVGWTETGWTDAG